MSEQLANFAYTTVAGGGYTAGSNILNVGSTSTGSGLQPFPGTGTFSVVIADQTTNLPKALLEVTAISSGTRFAVTNNGITPDVNCNAGDVVYAVIDARALNAAISGGVGGGISNQADVTASRAIGSIYHNTGSKPLFVAVTSFNTSLAVATALTDSNASPVQVVGLINAQASTYRPLLFWVLPGNYYQITDDHPGSATLSKWIEWS